MEVEKNTKQPPPSSLSSSRGAPSKRIKHKKLTRNPYLNYLNEFRQRNPNLPAVETIRRGALEWKELPREKKIHYIEAAFYTPKPMFEARETLALFPRDCSCKRSKRKRRHACGPKGQRRRKKSIC